MEDTHRRSSQELIDNLSWGPSLNKIKKKQPKDQKKERKLDEDTLDAASVSRAVFRLQSGFDYKAKASELFQGMLNTIMRVCDCEFGYIGIVEYGLPGKVIPFSISIQAVIDKRKDFLSQTGQDKFNKQIIESFLDPITPFGLVFNKLILIASGQVISKKQVVIESPKESAVDTPTRPRSHTIATDAPSTSRNVIPFYLDNFLGIPLFKTSDESGRTLLGVVGVANRMAGFADGFVLTMKPFLRTLEILIEAYINFQLVRSLQEHQQITDLTMNMKSADSGLLKDRKYHLKTYKHCLVGKESVTWIVEAGPKYGFKIQGREDAVELGNRMMKMGILHSPMRNTEFTDDQALFSFTDDKPTLAVPDFPSNHGNPPHNPGPVHSVSSPELSRKGRASSFLKTHLSMSHELSSSPPEKYYLHSLVLKKDYHSLKKKLTKKKVLDQLNALNDSQMTSLHQAIRMGDYVSVEILLQAYGSQGEKSLDFSNVKDAMGYTPLHLAAESDNERVILLVLQHPYLQINIKNDDGNTPFHCFCSKFGSPSSVNQIVELFLVKGAEINAQNNTGESPLHCAILNPKIRALLVRLLVARGSDVNLPNYQGDSPLHYAVQLERQDLVHTLLSGGANPNWKDPSPGMKSAWDMANDSFLEEIVSVFKKTTDLGIWLQAIDMKKYLGLFVKETIFLDILIYVDDKVLVEMGVSLAGERLRILQAIEKLKAEEDKKKTVEKSPGGRGSTRMRLSDMRRRLTLVSEKTTIETRPLTPVRSEIQDLKLSLEGSTEVNWISKDELEFTDLLGSGSSGDVFKGKYKNQEVAVKVLQKEGSTTNRIEEFKHEFKVMNTIRGNTIVRFYGACLEPKLSLVMEYCSRGSLYDVLNDIGLVLGWKDVLRFSIQMTQAIHVLHCNDPQILHRDVKSMNFLITRDWALKACDFGLSRFHSSDNNSTFYQLRGTMSYCSPETFLGNKFSASSDIYSLGVVFWEMLYRTVTGEYQRPYAEFPDLQPLQVLAQVSKVDLRPTIPHPEKCPKLYLNLVNTCWDSDPSKRPATKGILQDLEKIRLEFLEEPEKYH